MILRLSLVENKPALLRTQSKDLLVKSNKATTEETRVPAGNFEGSPYRTPQLIMLRLTSCYT